MINDDKIIQDFFFSLLMKIFVFQNRNECVWHNFWYIAAMRRHIYAKNSFVFNHQYFFKNRKKSTIILLLYISEKQLSKKINFGRKHKRKEKKISCLLLNFFLKKRFQFFYHFFGHHIFFPLFHMHIINNLVYFYIFASSWTCFRSY